jgi:hydroxyethylthiazole kinase-like uncharacterized protein yjeF
MSPLPQDPILSPEEASRYEAEFFAGDETLQWEVMTKAGHAVADAALRDMRELRTIPHRPRLMILVGKGHNGADALIAARRFLRTIPTARAVLWQWEKKENCRPLTQRAFEELIEFASKRVEVLPVAKDLTGGELCSHLNDSTKDRGFDLLIDGILGMKGKAGLKNPLNDWINLLNQSTQFTVRVSVDLPTGVTCSRFDDEEPFRADFTYCTGIVKTPVLSDYNRPWLGRLRYLDLGFFETSLPDTFSSHPKVLRSSALPLLRKLRPVNCDKRDFGHLLSVVGSRELGGAALMFARAALRGGVGLLTCCVPESLHPSFVAACPEAMWVPMPETPNGGLALEGLGKVRQFWERADALVVGPGVGPEEESHALIREVCKGFTKPVLVDADALRPLVIEPLMQRSNWVVTPHLGEWKRLANGQKCEDYEVSFPGVILRKGPHPKVLSGGKVLHLFSGSSVLARGGSGDLLSGIIGSLLARGDWSPLECAALGALWHGRAAEALARQHGQEAVTTTQVLDYLSFALRNDF